MKVMVICQITDLRNVLFLNREMVKHADATEYEDY